MLVDTDNIGDSKNSGAYSLERSVSSRVKAPCMNDNAINLENKLARSRFRQSIQRHISVKPNLINQLHKELSIIKSCNI